MKQDESRFTRFIQELETIDDEGKKVVDYGSGPEDVFIEVSEGAEPGQIDEAERILRVILSPSLKSFLLLWNGATLYKGKYRPGCRFFSIDELVDRNRIWQQEELLPEDRNENLLLFADMGDGDFVALDTFHQTEFGEHSVVDGDHNYRPGEWQTISVDVADWLDRLIEAEGQIFW